MRQHSIHADSLLNLCCGLVLKPALDIRVEWFNTRQLNLFIGINLVQLVLFGTEIYCASFSVTKYSKKQVFVHVQ